MTSSSRRDAVVSTLQRNGPNKAALQPGCFYGVDGDAARIPGALIQEKLNREVDDDDDRPAQLHINTNRRRIASRQG